MLAVVVGVAAGLVVGFLIIPGCDRLIDAKVQANQVECDKRGKNLVPLWSNEARQWYCVEVH